MRSSHKHRNTHIMHTSRTHRRCNFVRKLWFGLTKSLVVVRWRIVATRDCRLFIRFALSGFDWSICLLMINQIYFRVYDFDSFTHLVFRGAMQWALYSIFNFYYESVVCCCWRWRRRRQFSVDLLLFGSFWLAELNCCLSLYVLSFLSSCFAFRLRCFNSSMYHTYNVVRCAVSAE